MVWRKLSVVFVAAIFGVALFVLPSQAQAGGTYGPTGLTRVPPPAPTPAVVATSRSSVSTVTITVTPVQVPATEEPLVVSIRGLDGSVRRFPVEGGTAAIQTEQITLRAGQSVTVQLRAAR
jgi:hypothetical protein